MTSTYFILYSYNLNYDFSREDTIAITSDETLINQLYSNSILSSSNKFVFGIRQIKTDNNGKVIQNFIYKCNY
jgi:hypothetical protein